MILSTQINQQSYVFDSSKGIDISLPMFFEADKQNPNCYYAEPPNKQIIRFGDSFVGDVAEGGSCNYLKINLTPHGNGTHTECFGHISSQAATLPNALNEFLFAAALISVAPTMLKNGDQVITLKDILTFEKMLNDDCKALIIRTLPNESDKKIKQYSGTNPPYLAHEIGEFLVQKDIKHLLVDLPSVDRESDEGKLAMHKSFWQFPDAPRADCTITELVYVPNQTADGIYLLNLQAPNLHLDAVPSRPILYALINE